LLEQPHDLVRRHLARYRGKEVDTAGDGFASFDGPARAICCGCALAETVRELGLEVRVGVHTGECELVDGKAAAIAVHTRARVAANVHPGEVLVSSTVKDLVAGSVSPSRIAEPMSSRAFLGVKALRGFRRAESCPSPRSVAAV
jgi:class 3 adenylate cyclase